MEIERPPYGRVLLLLGAAVLSLSYAWDTFTAAGAGRCWSLPFRLAFVCEVPILGFGVAIVAILSAMGTVFVALTTVRTEEKPLLGKRRAVPPPRTEPPGWESIDRRFSIELNGKHLTASSIDELRTKLKAESALPDDEIERVLRMFEGALKP